jgi:hypothetical protein
LRRSGLGYGHQQQAFLETADAMRRRGGHGDERVRNKLNRLGIYNEAGLTG